MTEILSLTLLSLQCAADILLTKMKSLKLRNITQEDPEIIEHNKKIAVEFLSRRDSNAFRPILEYFYISEEEIEDIIDYFEPFREIFSGSSILEDVKYLEEKNLYVKTTGLLFLYDSQRHIYREHDALGYLFWLIFKPRS